MLPVHAAALLFASSVQLMGVVEEPTPIVVTAAASESPPAYSVDSEVTGGEAEATTDAEEPVIVVTITAED